MADYNFRSIENKWQKFWEDNNTFTTVVDINKSKFYSLDMFPYPSGAGLHVGHPLGYIASDIVCRYKRTKGFNVLHPMGFDSFGLPAEQYAIQTGQHPAVTTEENIKRYKEQLGNIGFSFDWNTEVQTSNPDFYKWTQWIFIQIFESWYNNSTDKAESIESLISEFEKSGNQNVNACCDDDTPRFSAKDWTAFSQKNKEQLLLHYRLTFPADAMVNWCPGLGTVLANDEIKDGFSERGGFPVERKKMKQWMMRITAFSDRLLRNLEKLDWSDAMKEMQSNWIGKSNGCELDFKVQDKDITLTAFTTRPDTIYGVTFIVLAPEHELINELVKSERKIEVDAYVSKAKNRSERDRLTDVKTVSGVFTGTYVINPFTNQPVQLWVADYVLAGYGTGVVMAVPSSDDRDLRFAQKFDLPVVRVIKGTEDLDDPTEKKHGVLINSGILNGLSTKDAIEKAIEHASDNNFGVRKINYRMRDAVFSRQRYWGEPVPAYFEEGIPKILQKDELPLTLPKVDEYLPTSTGEPPLGRAKNWKYNGEHSYELTTMPGWAGSSWYFLRYMDAQNKNEFAGKEATEYWNQVDLYIGGTEHATGHLLYSRFWNMFLFDRGFIGHEEPFKKLVNQGMIQGRSSFVYKLFFDTALEDTETDISKSPEIYLSKGIVDRIANSNLTGAEKSIIEKLIDNHLAEFNSINSSNWEIEDITKEKTTAIHVDISLVKNDILNIEGFKRWRTELKDAFLIPEANKEYQCGAEVEKMSKSKYNIVNPDDVVEKYGADTLRLYEMFLGPLEQFKPWNTNGIDGVYKFLKKMWRLYHDKEDQFIVSDAPASKEELKIIHKTIKKTEEDIERLSFNTAVSSFMICVNELTSLQCNKREILEKLAIIVSPFAPHMSEELWSLLGHKESITFATFPEFDESFIQEASHEYPVSVNGKMRVKMTFNLDMAPADIEKEVLASEIIQKWMDGKPAKKVIVVPKKIVNIVV